MIVEPIYNIANLISELLTVDLNLRIIHYVLIYGVYRLGKVNVGRLVRWRSK